jgi:hypothetical protein
VNKLIQLEQDIKELSVAKRLLENPGLAAKMSDFIGGPIEKGFELLPDNWANNLGGVTRAALTKSADLATYKMKDIPGEESSNKWHKLGVAASGGVGGFFGIAALAIELPISTSIMLRSIFDIARSEGESISTPEAKMACLEVFALGGKSESDDGTETGYFAVRAVLASSIADAAEHIVHKGLAKESAPALVKLIANIAERFGVQITQKAAAQAIPALGAAGGAIINTLFMDHFQDMARGHFIVRKLERTYGVQVVRESYDALDLA